MPNSYQLTEHLRRYNLSLPPPIISRQMMGSAHEFDDLSSVVFCNFNQAIKIDRDVFDVWMSIMRRVPNSVLWLLELPEASQPHLRRAAAARGVSSSRLHFMPSVDKMYHLTRMRRADLLLDTLIYNAHTSAGDAIWAGVPLLTVPGRTMASRVAAGMLRAAGLGDAKLIMRNIRDYEERAVELANDPAQLKALKARVGAVRLAQPPVALFDIETYYRNWMACLRFMWRRAVMYDLPPVEFDVANLTESTSTTWADLHFRA